MPRRRSVGPRHGDFYRIRRALIREGKGRNPNALAAWIARRLKRRGKRLKPRGTGRRRR